MGVSTEYLKPHKRLVVDEYHKTGAAGAARSGSIELAKFLQRKGIRPVLMPPQDLACTDWLPISNSAKAAEAGVHQSTNSVLMISPTAFGYNEEAAADNKFMSASNESSVGARVLSEFANLYQILTEEAGLQVLCHFACQGLTQETATLAVSLVHSITARAIPGVFWIISYAFGFAIAIQPNWICRSGSPF